MSVVSIDMKLDMSLVSSQGLTIEHGMHYVYNDIARYDTIRV